MIKIKSQEVLDENVLIDRSASGRVRPWAVHKLNSQYIQFAYEDVDPRKSERMRECAEWLAFKKTDTGKKLHDARFCRVRLCPICQWRRSLKTYAQMFKVIGEAARHGYQFIFLTLTVRNCSGDELSGTLSKMTEAFNRLMKYKDVKAAVKGYYRGIEVKHSIERDDFHPHIHCVFAVKKSYFSGQLYISQKKWSELWQKALKVDYVPVVDVRKCYGDYKSISEACKYAVKPGDIINPDDWEMTVDTLRILDSALDRRRFIGLGGIFKEIHKQLNLDDPENGDLIHTDEDSSGEAPEDAVLYFFWDGYSQYRL